MGRLSFSDTRHLVTRTALGQEWGDVKALEGKTRAEAISILLSPPALKTPPPPKLTPWANVNRMRMRNGAGKKQARMMMKREGERLKRWWMLHLLQNDTPVNEHMTLFWHNHFTSSLEKVEQPNLMLNQNKLLRENAMGNFRTLLHKIARDPAMLIYLDGSENVKGSPNENFARELLELFTLGRGHYNENDIKAAAIAFTGWGVNHIILKKPRTAEYIAEKFWKEFVSDSSPDYRYIKRWGAAFRKSNYNIRALYSEVLNSDAFWSPRYKVPLAGMVPGAFAAGQGNRPDQILLMVELKGGNDGLNTLIPFRDADYHRARPKLRVKNGIPLKDNMAMNPYLKNLLPLWKEGNMAWIQGVGYTNPSRSHFHSIDVWETASTRNNESQAARELGRIHKSKRSPVRFPTSRFGRKLDLVTQMIINGMDTPVYKVTLEGFDTHASQVDQHNNLMNHLGGGLQAFSSAMKRAGLWNNVMVITYSEFGRRVAENNSAGTDHGSAAPHFAIGGRVRGGMYGKQPSLHPSKLHDGDLIHTVDFREVYATLAQRWWRRPNPWQKQFRPIPFV
ncbi:hypothetical protein GQR58_023558 [Nymphon striatum]|nr:hypothetical protein GQR58_023558 [Nymphon striatum]